MAIAFPNAVKAVGANVTSVTTDPVTTTTGNTFVIACCFGSAPYWDSPASFTDSKGNTYTRTGKQNTDGCNIELAYCINGVGGAGHTATVAGSTGDYPTVFFLEISGVAAAGYDAAAHVKTADASAPYTVTSNALAQADSAVLALSTSWGSSVVNQTVISGFSVIKEDDFSNYFGGALGYKTVNSTAPQTATVGGVTANTALGIYAFKAAASDASVSPGGIASSAAYGAPAVGAGLAPAGVAGAAALGAPTTVAQLAPGGIGHAAAYGAPALALSLAPAGTATASVIGAPSAAAALAAAGVTAGEAWGTPTLTLTSGLLPGGIASAAAYGVPVLGVGLAPAGLASFAAFGTPTVMGTHSLEPAGVASAAAFGLPLVYDPDDTGPSEWVHWRMAAPSQHWAMPGEGQDYRIRGESPIWKFTP